MKNWLLTAGLLLLFTACNVNQRDYVDVFTVKQEMKDRKPKRIMEATVTEAAIKEGKKIMEKLLLLTPAPACGKMDYAKMDSATKMFIQSFDLICSLNECKTANEKQIFEAYQYNVANKILPTENIQKVDDKLLLFTFPLIKSDSLKGIFSIVLVKKEIIRQNF
jgi:hypothetical protein